MTGRCSVRQLGVALFVALLAPLSALPAVLSRGGALGWLGPAAAFPLAAWASWRIGKLGRDGLARRWRGRLWGCALLALYYLWACALSALAAGGCVDRLGRTDYGSAPVWLLSLALAGVSAYLVRKGAGAFFRAAEIFYLALLVVLALFFALGAADVRAVNLAPAGVGDLAGAAAGALPAAAALSVGALTAFFPRRRRQEGESPLWRWLLGWCLTAAGLCLLVFGTLGPALAAKAPLPFFLTLQELGFPGGFQRLEALGTAAWALSDLTLLSLAALAGREMAGGRPWAVWPPLLAAFLGGCFLPNAVVEGAAPWLMGANLLLGGAIPAAVSLLPQGVGEK